MSQNRITKAESVYKGRRNLLLLTLENSDGDTMQREVLESPPAAAVLPYDPVRRTAVLIRQFRAPALQAGCPADILEAIAGLIDPGETPEDGIRREATEEAGLRLGSLEHVGATWASPGYSTEQVHLFLAPYSETDRTGVGGGLAEEHEDIAVCEFPISDLPRLIESQALCDLKTMTLVQALALRHAELFPSESIRVPKEQA
ncbi:NUDIX domain-containing protein [Microvirga rosea]|uniref:NUDIX domain-containing protein n=1 Tax=Microvirga rosea TaxID=2715425 RepID=UPI001D0BB904|nr:NUDIX hydrolase [Microvirga rosea]MCB8819520.1 NUDIX hydrolase [Microvirga rosea]